MGWVISKIHIKGILVMLEILEVFWLSFNVLGVFMSLDNVYYTFMYIHTMCNNTKIVSLTHDFENENVS